MTALMEKVDAPAAVTVPKKTRSTAIAALRAQLREVVRIFSVPLGRNVATMIAASEQETELSKAFRDHFILARRNEGRTFLTRAMADGELRADLDLEIALDLIYAPIFYRLLMGHAPLDVKFTGDLLNHALTGLVTHSTRTAARKSQGFSSLDRS